MKGEQPPLGVGQQNIFLQNQPGGAPQAAEQQTQPPRSVLNSWVHSGVGLLGFGESNTRNEIEGYLSEGLAAAPLFMGGRRGIALSAVMSSLNEAKAGETGWHLASDLALGAAKGAGTKLAFDYLGGKKDWNFALKGVTMGATARGINVGLSRQTWFDQNDHFQPGTGFGTTALSMFHPYSLATDVVSFGIAHGTIKGLSGMSERFATKLENSPILQNSITAGTFGFTTGSLAELQRQMNDPNAHFDPMQILLRGTASAGTMTLAGAGGSYFSAPGKFVVRPQTEPFDPIGGIKTRYNQFRSWLGGGSSAGESTPIEPTSRQVETGTVQGTASATDGQTIGGSTSTPIETTSRAGERTNIEQPPTLADGQIVGGSNTLQTTGHTETISVQRTPSATDATNAVVTIERNASDPLTTERTIVRLQEPNSSSRPVVTNQAELNFARFNETNFDVWEPNAGFHFFEDTNNGHRAITSIEHHVRFELMDDGAWRARLTQSHQELRDLTPDQQVIFDRAMAMQRLGLAAERANLGSAGEPAESQPLTTVVSKASVDRAAEPERVADVAAPRAPLAVKGYNAVSSAIDALPSDIAEPMRDYLGTENSSKESARRLKQMEKVMSLSPEMRRESGIDDLFRTGLVFEDRDILNDGLKTARTKMRDAQDAELPVQQRQNLLHKQETLAIQYMIEHPNQPRGNTLQEFLGNEHLARRYDAFEHVDARVAARLVAENSGPGQALEVLNGNRPLAVIGAGGESLVILMEHPIGDTGHRVLKITFTGFQPEYGNRPFDTKPHLLTRQPIGNSRGKAMFYTQELLDTANIDPQKMDQFERDVENRGYFWTDRQVAREEQVGTDSNGNVVLADYGAISEQPDKHY